MYSEFLFPGEEYSYVLKQPSMLKNLQKKENETVISLF